MAASVKTLNTKNSFLITWCILSLAGSSEGLINKVINEVYINQLDTQIIVISLYFLLGALHVLDFLLVRHQERRFTSCVSQLASAYTGIYQMRCTACKMSLLMMD